MEISTTFTATDRASWRAWLRVNCAVAPDVWLLINREQPERSVSYLDAVEEALCFGWIDSTAKSYAPGVSAQRFSPRRARSKWTELNKARARRLIVMGLMTDAGRATLPDLTMQTGVPADIEAALRARPEVWSNWNAMPALYRAVRIGYVDEVRRQPEYFARRLENLVTKTAQNVLFGNWNDGGRLNEHSV